MQDHMSPENKSVEFSTDTSSENEIVLRPIEEDLALGKGEGRFNVGEAIFEVYTVTPDFARILLTRKRADAQFDNRDVDNYAAAMRNKAWVLNGQPIIFGRNGKLLDGLQRLMACIRSGVSFQTFLAWNINEELLHTMDQHRRRTYASILESRGIKFAGAMMRTMSRLIRHANGQSGFPVQNISWVHYDRVFESNPEIREAVSMSERYSGSPLRATVRHCIAYFAIAAGQRPALEKLLNDLDGIINQSPGSVLGQLLRLNAAHNIPVSIETQMAWGIMALNDTIRNHNGPTGGYIWEPNYGSTRLDKDGNPIGRYLADDTPPNLGMPEVIGFPGLKAAKSNIEEAMSDPSHLPLSSGWQSAVSEYKEYARGVSVSLVVVTPKVAREWLNRYNRNNRKILEGNIKILMRDMVAGNFMLNGQPVCFAEDGRLLNGQHRLEACARADQSIELIIVRGLPEEAFSTYDIHSHKTRLDFNNMEGKGNNVDLRIISAAATFLWRRETGRDPTGRDRASSTEIHRVIEENPGLLDGFAQARRMKNLASAGVMTYLIYVFEQENEVVAAEFLDHLETGAGLTSKNPVLKLRDELMTSRSAPGEYRRTAFLKRIEQGWEDYKIWHERQQKLNGKLAVATKIKDKTVETNTKLLEGIRERG